jgi:drug/metabolite transporter (DMT)-like permease
MNTGVMTIALLAAVTVCYAGYNVFVKLSGSIVPATATTTVLATIALQLAALTVSVCFYLFLVVRGGSVFELSGGVYFWAIMAGVCIGLAEIGYLYLFAGVGGMPAMSANLAIPVVVSGTIVIALAFSIVFLKEPAGLLQFIGSGLICCGVAVLFMR